MLSFLRAAHPPRTNSASHNPVIYENGRSSILFRQAGSQYFLQNKFPPEDGDVSIVKPPFHFHIHQDEFFQVVKGSVHLYSGRDPKPWKTLSDAPGAENSARVPKQVYHGLENASKTDELVLDIHLTPENYEGEQSFFRNLFGYMDDCKRAGVAPSPFQLFVFLHAADTPLAITLPWDWLGRLASRVVLIGMAYFGRWVLGYSTSYPEYYDSKKSL